MKRYLGVVFVLAVFSFLSAACAQNKEASGSSQGEVLDFTFKGLKQNSLSLADFRQKQPVALLFWTTWCPYCRKEIQSLNTNYDNLQKQGWEILAIDAGEPAYKVEAYRNAHDIKIDMFLDEDMKVANSLEILGVPTYVVIDKKGHLVAKAHEFSPETYKHLLTE